MGNFHKEALDMLPGKEAAFAFGKNQAVSSISLSNLFSSLGSGRFSVGLGFTLILVSAQWLFQKHTSGYTGFQ